MPFRECTLEPNLFLPHCCVDFILVTWGFFFGQEQVSKAEAFQGECTV
jgi:hypothetical protein